MRGLEPATIASEKDYFIHTINDGQLLQKANPAAIVLIEKKETNAKIGQLFGNAVYLAVPFNL